MTTQVTIQWIITILIIIAAIAWCFTRRKRKRQGDCPSTDGDNACADCPLKKNCEKN